MKLHENHATKKCALFFLANVGVEHWKKSCHHHYKRPSPICAPCCADDKADIISERLSITIEFLAFSCTGEDGFFVMTIFQGLGWNQRWLPGYLKILILLLTFTKHITERFKMINSRLQVDGSSASLQLQRKFMISIL